MTRQPDQQSLLDQLREANEQLVVSAMRAQDLADQAVAARAEAETANALKNEFLTMVSHELRTPLSAVLLGEGIWALNTIADTTSPVYWTLEIVLAVLFLYVLSVARRLTSVQRDLDRLDTTIKQGGRA